MITKLPKQLFGEMLQALYNSEVHFTITCLWDGGFEWSKDYFTNHKENRKGNECSNDIELIGADIFNKYYESARFDSKNELTPFGLFCKKVLDDSNNMICYCSDCDINGFEVEVKGEKTIFCCEKGFKKSLDDFLNII